LFSDLLRPAQVFVVEAESVAAITSFNSYFDHTLAAPHFDLEDVAHAQVAREGILWSRVAISMVHLDFAHRYPICYGRDLKLGRASKRVLPKLDSDRGIATAREAH
jgi:hypothetical protein